MKAFAVLLLSVLLAGRSVPAIAQTATPQPVAIGDARFVARRFAIEQAALAAADFDQDGHLDLVSAGEPHLVILGGDGAGGFSPVSHMAGGMNPVDFAIADLDEDGALDIVVANHDTDYLTILLGDGQGSFQPAPNSPLRINVLPHPHAVRAIDLDRDSHMDLVVDDREAEGLLILPGLGNGWFELPGWVVGVGGDPYRGMAVGDLNADGLPDLVTPNPHEVGVVLNASDDQIAFDPAAPVPADAPFRVGLGDFNGDGWLDLIAASDEGSALVEIFWGDGQGGFQAADSPLTLAPGAKCVVVGDFNADGIADAAVASYQSPEVLVLLGGRDEIQTGLLPGDAHPWSLAAGDFNEDGRDDLVIGDDVSQMATLYLTLGPDE